MFFLENKNFFQKIIISLLIIIVCSFVFSSKVKAKDDGPGGKLLRPVSSLLLGLDDGFMDFIHNGILNQNKSYIRVDLTSTVLNVLATVGIGLLAVIITGVVLCAAVAAVPAILGALGIGAASAGAAAATAITTAAGTIAVVSLGGGIIGGYAFSQNCLSDDLYLPLYSITPEEIISGNMAIFDVDFFNPNTELKKEKNKTENCSTLDVAISKIKEEYHVNVDKSKLKFDDVKNGQSKKVKVGTIKTESGKEGDIYIIYEKSRTVSQGEEISMDTYYISGPIKSETKTETVFVEQCSSESEVVERIKEKYNISVNKSTLSFHSLGEGQSKRQKVGEIESTKQGVYIEFVKGIKPIGTAYGVDTKSPDRYNILVDKVDKESSTSKGSPYASIAYQLRGTVAAWYKTLRNIAIVGSLSILIYIAIRIIISSSSADKSKYKQRLYDWLVSICLIFVMHYIMAGSNIFVKKLSGLLNSVQKPSFCAVIQDSKKDKIKEALENNKELLDEYYGQEVDIDSLFTDAGEFAWSTNLMGTVRLQAQMVKDSSGVTFAGYTIMFTALTILTGIFTWTYLKRIAYLALLTILAPFVAMTYALDKLKDGSAQGFNNWFKEYLVNLLIQPIHLLLYTVLVSSALELAETNLVYSIVAIAFIMPSEKLVRRFFGINATETQGFLSGAAGGALAMAGLNRLLGHRPQGPKDDSGKGDQNNQNGKITFKDSSKTDSIFKKNGDDNSDSGDDGSSGLNDGSGIDTIDSTDDTTNSPGTDNGPDDGQNGPNGGITDLPYADVNEDAWRQAMLEEDAWNIPNNNELNNKGDANSSGNIKPAKLEPVRQQPISNQSKQSANQTKKKQIKTPSTKSSTQPKPSSTQSTKNTSTTPNTTSDTTRNNDLSKFQRMKNGLARGLKFYGRGVLQNIDKNWKPGSGIKKVARAGLGVGVGALAGMAGASAGIATGDAKSTWQDAAAGAIAGYKFGSSPNPDVPGVLKVENAGEYFARGYYGDKEYEKLQDEKKINKMIEEKMNDEFVKQFSTRTELYDENKAKDALKEDNFLEESLKHGFYDANEIAALYKAKNIIHNQEDAFGYTQIVKETGVDINTFEYDSKKKEAYIKSLEDKYKYNNPKASEKEINNAVNTIYDRLKQISDVYYTQ